MVPDAGGFPSDSAEGVNGRGRRGCELFNDRRLEAPGCYGALENKPLAPSSTGTHPAGGCLFSDPDGHAPDPWLEGPLPRAYGGLPVLS
jgi:hypothetical protein